MKTKLIRVLVALCAVFVLLSAVTACSSTGGEGKQTTAGGTTAGGTTAGGTTAGGTTAGDTTAGGTTAGDGGEEEIDETVFAPKQDDFDEYTFKMLLDSGQNKNNWGFSGTTNTEDVIDTAFFSRNEYLQEFYNIEILVEVNGSSLTSFMSGQDQSQKHYADIVIGVASSMLRNAVPNGLVLDLNNVEGLNLEGSYWDQRIQEGYALEGMLFALEGDYTVWDDLRTHVVLYNADLYEEYRYQTTYGSPYEVVREGEWTLALMMEMFRDRSDIASGELGKNSQWGMLSETAFAHVVFLGTGVNVVPMDRRGVRSVALADDTLFTNVYDTMNYVIGTLSASKEILLADNNGGILGSDIWTDVSAMFESGQALFRSTTMSAALRLENMESNFGILPAPKYEEGQEEYYSWCAATAHSPLLIPATAMSASGADLTRTATILDAIGYTSKYMPNDDALSLLDAFKYYMSVVKLCRTGEDYEMMNLVLSNKVFDFDVAYGITGLFDLSVSLIKTPEGVNTLGSSLGSIADSAEQKLSDLVEDAVTNVRN